MTERVRSRSGTPTRWAEPAPDDADPMGGRHVLDQDAGMTPIFTTLRRGAWRRPRPQSARRTLRPVPDPVPYSDDPWTAPIPVVPPLTVVDDPHGVDATGGYGAVSGYEPPVSETESTAWWGLPVVTASTGEHDRAGSGDPYGSGSYEATPYGSASYIPAPSGQAAYTQAAYDQAAYDQAAYDQAAYDQAAYHQAAYDQAAYDRSAYDRAAYDQAGYDGRGYDQAGYDQAGYDQAGYDPAPYGRAPHDPLPYQPAAYEPVLYGAPHRFPRHDPRPHQYDPLTDTGRHHRRLAPAGW